jgi:pilus assembly protein CpaF
MHEKNMKVKNGPLFEIGMKSLVRKDPLPEANQEVSEKVLLIEQLKDKTLRRTIDEMDERVTVDRFSLPEKERFHRRVSEMLNMILAGESRVLSRVDREKIIREVTDEITGYGPIDPFLHDPEITEVMVNGPRRVYVEKAGIVHKTDVVFRDDDHVLHTIEKIVGPLGRRLDDASPLVDARLPDGSRVNAIIPPLAVCGPTLTVRKFSRDPYTVEDLISFGTLNTEIAMFLKMCVQSRINIIISGGTSSGKTTTLNVLSSFIPENERIVTIEDAAELQLWQEHVVPLEARPPNIEGRGRVTIRDLVINTLRMRPDRIIVGEVRGGEALDMLQAMNTGHDGSITTGHANSPRDMLFRLETMVLMAGVELPVRAIREQIATALNLVVYQNRMRDGARKVTKVSEIVGMEGDTITLQDIFVFEQTGIDEKGRIKGRHRPTGIVPRFIEKIESAGLYLPAEIFRSPVKA